MKKKKLKKLVRKLQGERYKFLIERNILIDCPDSFEAHEIIASKKMEDMIDEQINFGTSKDNLTMKGIFNLVKGNETHNSSNPVQE